MRKREREGGEERFLSLSNGRQPAHSSVRVCIERRHTHTLSLPFRSLLLRPRSRSFSPPLTPGAPGARLSAALHGEGRRDREALEECAGGEMERLSSHGLPRLSWIDTLYSSTYPHLRPVSLHPSDSVHLYLARSVRSSLSLPRMLRFAGADELFLSFNKTLLVIYFFFVLYFFFLQSQDESRDVM